ncbi:hypothetical protein D3C76_1657540 [compost metagenome]
MVPDRQCDLRRLLLLHNRLNLGLELLDVLCDPQGVISELSANIHQVVGIVGFDNLLRDVARNPSQH